MPRHVHFLGICSTVIETLTDTNTTRISPQTTMQRDTEIESLEKKIEELTRELREKTRAADEATTKLPPTRASSRWRRGVTPRQAITAFSTMNTTT
jgi:predicted RNase H-like nuclease (RuvC/YqgF family)